MWFIRDGLPVVSEGGWLSTGNTVICRSYTGRLSLVLAGLPSLQHRAEFSASPSEMTKVMVSWRGVSPISCPETTIIEVFSETCPNVLNVFTPRYSSKDDNELRK